MRSVCGLWPLMVSHHASVSLRSSLLRHAFVDEADLDRFLRAEAPRAEDHLAREPLADDARQVLRRAHGRAGADLGAGLAEHGVLGGDDQVAPQRKLVAAAHAPAVDHGDDRNRQAADGHGQALHAVVPHGAVDQVEPLHGVEIAAGGKRLVAGAGHDRAGDRGILAGGFQRVDQLIERLLAERVEHARPVDGRPTRPGPSPRRECRRMPLGRAAFLGCGLFRHVSPHRRCSRRRGISPERAFWHHRRGASVRASSRPAGHAERRRRVQCRS